METDLGYYPANGASHPASTVRKCPAHQGIRNGSWGGKKGKKPGVGVSSPKRLQGPTVGSGQEIPCHPAARQAPEQGSSVSHACQGPLPAFGMLWEGMVEAAWRGLL